MKTNNLNTWYWSARYAAQLKPKPQEKKGGSLVWLVVIVLAIVLFGCSNTVTHEVVIEIDGCEYIESDGGIFDQRVYSLTHKGNCNNHEQNGEFVATDTVRTTNY